MVAKKQPTTQSGLARYVHTGGFNRITGKRRHHLLLKSEHVQRNRIILLVIFALTMFIGLWSICL